MWVSQGVNELKGANTTANKAETIKSDRYGLVNENNLLNTEEFPVSLIIDIRMQK